MTFDELPKKKIKDIFDINKNLITVQPEMLARDLSYLFLEKDISGAPVVNENNELMGIVSMTDLAKSEAILDLKGVLELIFLDAPEEIMKIIHKHLAENYHELTVGDIMTTIPICVAPDDGLSDVMDMMLENNIHRIIISQDNKPLGIITNTDILTVISYHIHCS